MNDSNYDNAVMRTVGICDLCLHRRDVLTCAAYPSGIPGEVLTGDVDHRQPYVGDQGIQFLPSNQSAAAEVKSRLPKK